MAGTIWSKDRYLVTFGELHIEMTLWKIMGQILENSGICAVLTETGIASPEAAETILKVTHLKKMW